MRCTEGAKGSPRYRDGTLLIFKMCAVVYWILCIQHSATNSITQHYTIYILSAQVYKKKKKSPTHTCSCLGSAGGFGSHTLPLDHSNPALKFHSFPGSFATFSLKHRNTTVSAPLTESMMLIKRWQWPDCLHSSPGDGCSHQGSVSCLECNGSDSCCIMLICCLLTAAPVVCWWNYEHAFSTLERGRDGYRDPWLGALVSVRNESSTAWLRSWGLDEIYLAALESTAHLIIQFSETVQRTTVGARGQICLCLWPELFQCPGRRRWTSAWISNKSLIHSPCCCCWQVGSPNSSSAFYVSVPFSWQNKKAFGTAEKLSSKANKNVFNWVANPFRSVL